MWTTSPPAGPPASGHEIGIVGTAAAVANAVHLAIGARVGGAGRSAGLFEIGGHAGQQAGGALQVGGGGRGRLGGQALGHTEAGAQ